jgi:hypothetical protein
MQLTESTDHFTAELDMTVLRGMSTRGLQSTVPNCGYRWHEINVALNGTFRLMTALK